jgi:transposase-like protein
LGWLDWPGETGEAWAALFGQLRPRGLEGAELVISDAHKGLVRAAEAAFPKALWQQCQVQFLRRSLEQGRKKGQTALSVSCGYAR